MSAAAKLLDRLEGVRAAGPGKWQALCPAHADRNPSLSIDETEGGDVLLHCHAGCAAANVVERIGLSMPDLFAESSNGAGREIVATYDYVDEGGALLFQVVRFAPKDFRQRRPDGQGGWDWKLGRTRKVLYRLPEIVKADAAGETVYIAEGEKDVHALERVGVTATCNPGGAGKWRSEYTEMLTYVDVVIVADTDEPGRRHANKVAEELKGIASSVRIVEAAEGKDAADHLAAGKTIDELVPLSASSGKCPPADKSGQIDTAELLDEIKTFITRFVVLPSDAAADVLALWTLHTHSFTEFWATPYIRVVSATADSGKTLLMEVLASVCRRGWHAVNPSVAVLYRKVDRDQPTLLLDEVDNYPLDDRKDALAVLNTGYKRGATVDRCKENGDLQSFSAYCPKVYAGLDVRSMVPTLLSRSITIRMEKKIATEKVDMWIAPLVEPGAVRLRERCEAWAGQHAEQLTDHQPDLLGLINRAAEVWWALLAIAEYAGGAWEARAKAAAAKLATGGDDTDESQDGVGLLADIRGAFKGVDAIFTKDLLDWLNQLDESPWGARRRGEGLDARGLGRMLRPFKVKPKSIRIGEETAKGYHLEQFEDPFARHLPKPSSQASQASQASQPASVLERDVTDVTDVTDNPTPSGTVGSLGEGVGCDVHRDAPKAGCRYCGVAV